MAISNLSKKSVSDAFSDLHARQTNIEEGMRDTWSILGALWWRSWSKRGGGTTTRRSMLPVDRGI
jgi:hypothetical protein